MTTLIANSEHVLPAMISKLSGAMKRSKHYEVTLWGDGSARREFFDKLMI